MLAEPALAHQLESRTTLSWDGQGVGAALERLASVQRLPLWIDRRIDPNSPINLAVSNATAGEVLDRVAADETHDWGWTALGGIVYFGPRQTARELATLSELARQAIAKESVDERRVWLTPKPWEFPRLSEPRALLAETLAGVGAEVQGVDAVGHDLWPARSFAAVAPVDRVVLLLAGFDLTMTPQSGGKPLRVAPIARPVQLSRIYAFSERATAATDELLAQDKTVRVRRQGRRLIVAGRWEDHEGLKLALTDGPAPAEPVGPPSGDATPAAQRFTLRIENKPVGPVLAQLAGQLQLVIAWDPALAAASPPMTESLVSCDVHDVDLDGLLEAVLKPVGLAFTREGPTVTIRAAQ